MSDELIYDFIEDREDDTPIVRRDVTGWELVIFELIDEDEPLSS